VAEEKTYKPADLNKDGKVKRGEQARYNKSKRAEFESMLPAQYALLSQDEKVKELLDRKVREYLDNPEDFSKEAFFIELDNQPYFQKFSKAAIRDMDLEQRLPQVWKQEVDAEVDALRDAAVQYGAADATDEELRSIAIQKRRMGLNESQVRNALAGLVDAKAGVYAGQAGELQRNMQGWAKRNGIALSDNLIADYVRRIQRGDTTEADALADFRRTYMAGAYPAWADKIDAGYDIADIAKPYKSTMAQLLELGEYQIDMNDPLLQRGLQGVGPDGKPSVTPLYQFQREVRNDPRWQKTDNAYATYASAADDILSMFGFR